MTLEQNPYYIHRKAIYEMWEAHTKAGEPCDLSTACAEFRYKMGWADPDEVKDGIDEAISQFTAHVHSLKSEEIEAFFLGE